MIGTGRDAASVTPIGRPCVRSRAYPSDSWYATLAVAVFGLSAAHVEAYAWISARHVAIAGALCGAALAVRGGRHGRWLGPLVLAIGLTSSEAALAAVPLWIALELAASRRWRDRVVRCLPVVGLAAAYLAIYGALGYGTRGSEGYHDPSTDPIGFARLAVVRVPLLLGDAALGIPAELAHVVAAWWLAVLGVAAVGVVALGVWWTAPRHPAAGPALEARTLGWLAVGGLGGTVLGAAGYPAGRMLVIPDLAFAAVLGVVLYRGLTARWPGRIVAGTLAIAHLVIAPLAQVRTIDKLAHRADRTDAVADTVVALAPSSGRVFVLAASDPMVFLYPRGILSDRYPGTVRCWSVISAARASHRITRTSERGFTLEPVERTLLDGSFDQLFRAADRPFAIGDTIEQCGATIRVTAVRGGRPSRLDIALRRKLDDPELVWLVWRDHQLARFTFPAIGETTMLPWSPGPSGVL